MPVTQFGVTDTYEYLNGFGGYKEYVVDETRFGMRIYSRYFSGVKPSKALYP
jgi:hypothetical protein